MNVLIHFKKRGDKREAIKMSRSFFFSVCFCLTISASPLLGGWVKSGVPQNGIKKINSLIFGSDSTGTGNLFFAGTDSGVYISSDTGTSWSFLNGSPKNVLSFCDNVLAGTSDSGVYDYWPWRSKGHSQWGPIYAIKIPDNSYLLGTNTGVYCGDVNIANAYCIGLANHKINALSITLYSLNIYNNSTSYYFYAGTDTGVYFSNYFFSDSPYSVPPQASWSARNNGLSSLHIKAITSPEIAYFKDTNIVIAGTDIGIFISKNKGESWSSFNDGLTDNNISTLLYGGFRYPYLFAATYVNNVAAVWRCPLSDITSVVIAEKSLIPTVKFDVCVNNMLLRYTLRRESDVSVKIFDLRGRLVFATITQGQSAGPHTLPLAAKGFSSGNYVLDFSAGMYRERKAIAVMR